MTRWLVTGARGQLGHDLLARLAGRDVTALGRAELDLTDEAAVREVVGAWVAASTDDAVVLNAAAYTAVDAAEFDEDTAWTVNGRAPGWIAAAIGTDARLVHVSTDYVFAGDADEPYEVDAATGPRSAYGRTKLAGERAVLGSEASAYVVRTAWVYGATGANFVKTMARLEREHETIDVVADQLGSPTWSADLAAGLVELAVSGAPYGVYHCTSAGQTSWHGLAEAVFEELGADPARVRPTTTAAMARPAARPAYSVLSATGWTGAGLTALPHWRQALRNAVARHGELLRPAS